MRASTTFGAKAQASEALAVARPLQVVQCFRCLDALLLQYGQDGIWIGCNVLLQCCIAAPLVHPKDVEEWHALLSAAWWSTSNSARRCADAQPRPRAPSGSAPRRPRCAVAANSAQLSQAHRSAPRGRTGSARLASAQRHRVALDRAQTGLRHGAVSA